jgi:hypothetical protein
MPSERPLRLYNWRPKSLAKLKLLTEHFVLLAEQGGQCQDRHAGTASTGCPYTRSPGYIVAGIFSYYA